MAKKLKVYDSAEFLDSPEAIEEYLVDAFDSEDISTISNALGVVARARGISKLAEDAGLSRQTLYRTLSVDGNPELGTVIKVAHALGFKLGVSPQRVLEDA
jgi:probable addiction module antidote protein